jgi:hypothetical protein
MSNSCHSFLWKLPLLTKPSPNPSRDATAPDKQDAAARLAARAFSGSPPGEGLGVGLRDQRPEWFMGSSREQMFRYGASIRTDQRAALARKRNLEALAPRFMGVIPRAFAA